MQGGVKYDVQHALERWVDDLFSGVLLPASTTSAEVGRNGVTTDYRCMTSAEVSGIITN